MQDFNSSTIVRSFAARDKCRDLLRGAALALSLLLAGGAAAGEQASAGYRLAGKGMAPELAEYEHVMITVQRDGLEEEAFFDELDAAEQVVIKNALAALDNEAQVKSDSDFRSDWAGDAPVSCGLRSVGGRIVADCGTSDDGTELGGMSVFAADGGDSRWMGCVTTPHHTHCQIGDFAGCLDATFDPPKACGHGCPCRGTD